MNLTASAMMRPAQKPTANNATRILDISLARVSGRQCALFANGER